MRNIFSIAGNAGDNSNPAVSKVDELSSLCMPVRDSHRGDAGAVALWPPNAIATLYAYALVTGRQATAACNELSAILESHGDHAVAVLFHELADAEMLLVDQLVHRVGGAYLPPLPSWQYSWLYTEEPGQTARDMLAHLMTPHFALKIALAVASRDQALYVDLSSTPGHCELRAQAQELAATKMRLVQRLGNALASSPPPLLCQEDFAGLWPIPPAH